MKRLFWYGNLLFEDATRKFNLENKGIFNIIIEKNKAETIYLKRLKLKQYLSKVIQS